ncbi:hypothetical protein [Acinetobacter lwoffii]|jgi:hypothetical protein|uniref:hypothetical protein n=1 Tax=Acinetobacter lwoffii TaxID=28090 RepID=UPI00110CFC09|nr:hypothetical protein [Acinetobacter lwoffii]NGP41066.1 hypothetical protein [Acinetobacter lwoffii]TMS43491.1 hypothetical protein FGQ54_14600 [Acinetobacter lwoffii]
MNDVTTPEDERLLTEFLTDIHRQSYLSAALNLQNGLQDGISSGDIQPAETSVTDHFSKGLYLREFKAKAGTLAVSKMHRTEHIIIFLTGSVSIATDNGVELIKAPCIAKTTPGTKRVAYFHEDSICVTVHATELSDVDEIEKEIIVPEGEERAFLTSIGRSIEEFTSCHG